MSKPFRGTINVDIRDSTPDWEPYTQPMAPDGAPNVLYIVLDDVGFSAMEPFGGLIETPNINRIAERGLTYTNFHTTALCSPTRACLLTGRNHTTNGMACITEASAGFPSQNGHIPFECGTLAEVLGERGWNTYAVGKWHLTAADEMNLASRKTQWPLGRGFERFYGFLGAETNQWYPDLVLRQPPGRPALLAGGGLPLRRRHHRQGAVVHPGREGDRARQAVLHVLLPRRRPCAAPRAEGVGGQVQGQVRHGLRGLSRDRLRAAEEDGHRHRPGRAVADQPVHRRAERGRQADWPELDTVRPWDSLSDDEKRLFCRMAEVYAGFLSHADHEIGRLLDYLEETGELDNTLIVLVSDNGASGEGGPNGSVNENKIFNGLPDQIEENLPFLDELGGPKTYNHYPTGWAFAFNTPVQAVEALLQLGGRHRRPDDRVLARAINADRAYGGSTRTRSTSSPRSTSASASSRPRSSRATRSTRSRA